MEWILDSGLGTGEAVEVGAGVQRQSGSLTTISSLLGELHMPAWCHGTLVHVLGIGGVG